MKLLKCIILSCLLFTVSYQPNITAETVTQQDFSGGWIDRFHSTIIPDNATPDCLNVLFDEQYGITKRQGSIKYNSTAIGTGQKIRRMFTYSKNNGTHYIIANTSWTVYYSLGDGNFTPITSGKNSSYDYMFTVAGDVLYASNGNNNVWKWNGTTLTTLDISNSTNVPVGKYIVFHKNRLFSAGVSGNPSILYYTELIDFENWGLEPNVEYIGKDDGDYITGLYSYGDYLYIFKQYSIWVLQGTSPTEWVIRCISKNVGCLYQTTISEYQGYLCFMSHRGVELFDGIKLTKISEPIQETIKGLRQINFAQLEWTQTTGIDFGAGNSFVSVDTYTTVGTVKTRIPPYTEISTHTTTIDSKASFTGTTGNVFGVTYGTNVVNTISLLKHSMNTSNIWFYGYTGAAPSCTFWAQIELQDGTVLRTSTRSVQYTDGVTPVWYEMDITTITLTITTYYRLRVGGSQSGGTFMLKCNSAYTFEYQIYASSITSSYISQTLNAGANWTQWNTFNTNDTVNNYGGIKYYVKVSTYNNGLATSPPIPVTDGYEIQATSGPYLQVVSSGINDYTIDDFTISWYEGAPVDPPHAIEYNDRYWLSVATDNVVSNNNVIFVFDDKGKWTKFNNIFMGAGCIYRQNLYTGSSLTDGYVYRQDVNNVYTDDSKPYESFWTSKVYDYGNPFNDKLFRTMYLSCENSGNWNLTSSYRLHGSTGTWTDKSISLNANYPIKKKIPFTHVPRSRYIQYKFENSSAGQKFNIRRYDVNYDIQPTE